MNLTPEQVKHMVDTMSPEEIKSWVQQEGYKAWAGSGKRGSVIAATGVGKTVIGLLAAHAEFELNPNALIYIAVPTETLRDVDWPNEMDKFGFSYMKEKTRRICYTSLGKEIPERDVDLFIGDEFHHVTTANSVFFSDDRWKVFYILSLTATMPDKNGYEQDKEKWELINSLAPVCFTVTVEEAIELKLVSDFEVSILTFDLDSTDAYIEAGTPTKPFKQTEMDHYKYLTKNLGKAMWNKKNEGAKFVWMQKRMSFIYNLRSKTLLAKEVMKKILPGNRTLIFCGSIDQSVLLCGEKVYNSGTNTEQLDLFCNEEIDYCGVVQILDEGKNIPNLDQGLVVQIQAQARRITQRIGRHIRFREGHKARMVVLVAKNTVDEKWCAKAFENFDQKRIKTYYVKPEYRNAKASN